MAKRQTFTNFQHSLISMSIKNMAMCDYLFLFSVLLITGGVGDGGSGLTSVEVLSPSGVLIPCSVPRPAYRSYHTQDGAVACGGGDAPATLTSCSSLTASGWSTSHQLQERRHRHVSWLSPVGLLLMGGWGSRLTTELLTDTSSSSSPSFDLEYDTR